MYNKIPTDRNQIFVFDRRSASIRQAYRRHFAIGTRKGIKYRPGNGSYFVARRWHNNYQNLKWVRNSRGGNFRTPNNKCMEIQYNSNT
jgi:hypothetical protein